MPNSKLLNTIEDHGAQDSEDEGESLPEVRLKRRDHALTSGKCNSVDDDAEPHDKETITVEITGGVDDLPLTPARPRVDRRARNVAPDRGKVDTATSRGVTAT